MLLLLDQPQSADTTPSYVRYRHRVRASASVVKLETLCAAQARPRSQVDKVLTVGEFYELAAVTRSRSPHLTRPRHLRPSAHVSQLAPARSVRHPRLGEHALSAPALWIVDRRRVAHPVSRGDGLFARAHVELAQNVLDV